MEQVGHKDRFGRDGVDQTQALPGSPERRWRHRPDGSNWGDFGADDQLGRVRLMDSAKVLAAAKEIKVGRTFCLSLPLDYPGGSVLAPFRFPPSIRSTEYEGVPYFHYNFGRQKPRFRDIVCDDCATLCTQYSTHWDALGHFGQVFDADGDGAPEVVYYNGYRPEVEVISPERRLPGQSTALGIEHLAVHGMQGRGVLVDLAGSFGPGRHLVSYEDFRRCLDVQRIAVEPGDVLCLHTGFSTLLLEMNRQPDWDVLKDVCPALDGTDERLLNWITESGIAAIACDNFAVEAYPPNDKAETSGLYCPLHAHCLVKIGIPLGELWYFNELNQWLRQNNRHHFFLTAPPLRLPGGTGSPLTPIATV